MSDRDSNQLNPGQSDPGQSDPGQSNSGRADHLQAQYRAAPKLVTPAAMDQRIMQSARVAAEARSQSRVSERSSGVGVNWWPKAGALVATFAVVGLGLKLLIPTAGVPESSFDIASNTLSEDSASSPISKSATRSVAPTTTVANQLESSALNADQVASTIASADVSSEDDSLNVSDADLDAAEMDSDATGVPETLSQAESVSDLFPQLRVMPAPPAAQISGTVEELQLNSAAENTRKFVPEPSPELARSDNSTDSDNSINSSNLTDSGNLTEGSNNEKLDETVAESELPDLADRSVLLRSEKTDAKQIAGKSFASGVIRQSPESDDAGQRWLMNLPPQSYTLVLAQSESESDLRELVNLLKLKPPVFTVAHGDGVQWLLLHGNYTDLQLAATAAGEILESRDGALEIRTVRVSEIIRQVR